MPRSLSPCCIAGYKCLLLSCPAHCTPHGQGKIPSLSRPPPPTCPRTRHGQVLGGLSQVGPHTRWGLKWFVAHPWPGSMGAPVSLWGRRCGPAATTRLLSARSLKSKQLRGGLNLLLAGSTPRGSTNIQWPLSSLIASSHTSPSTGRLGDENDVLDCIQGAVVPIYPCLPGDGQNIKTGKEWCETPQV